MKKWLKVFLIAIVIMLLGLGLVAGGIYVQAANDPRHIAGVTVGENIPDDAIADSRVIADTVSTPETIASLATAGQDAQSIGLATINPAQDKQRSQVVSAVGAVKDSTSKPPKKKRGGGGRPQEDPPIAPLVPNVSAATSGLAGLGSAAASAVKVERLLKGCSFWVYDPEKNDPTSVLALGATKEKIVQATSKVLGAQKAGAFADTVLNSNVTYLGILQFAVDGTPSFDVTSLPKKNTCMVIVSQRILDNVCSLGGADLTQFQAEIVVLNNFVFRLAVGISGWLSQLLQLAQTKITAACTPADASSFFTALASCAAPATAETRDLTAPDTKDVYTYGFDSDCAGTLALKTAVSEALVEHQGKDMICPGFSFVRRADESAEDAANRYVFELGLTGVNEQCVGLLADALSS